MRSPEGIVVFLTDAPSKNASHCEPVRTLAWQSPSTFRKFGGDSHVGAYAPPRNDMRFWMVHQNAKLQFNSSENERGRPGWDARFVI